MAFFLVKNLVLIDSMQFMNFSPDKLVKDLSDGDFKYLVKEFGSKNLKILNQKGAYPYEYMNSFKRFNEEKLCTRKYFFNSTKKERLMKMVKYQMVTYVLKIIWFVKKIGINLKSKIWVIIMIII